MRVNADHIIAGQPELGLTVTEAARRAQIISATIATIGELGYAKTTFAKIKERAGLSSTRIISYHFVNKAGLMQQVLSTVADIKARFLAERADGRTDPADRPGMLREYIAAEVAFLGAYPECVRVFLEMGAHPDDEQGWSMTAPVLRELRVGQLMRQLTQGQREGVFGEFSPEIMAMAVRQAVDGVAAQLTADPELDLERYGKELADLFERTTKAPVA
jgi:AcrR family transcriptional regulator